MAKLIGLDNINMPAYKAALKKIEELNGEIENIKGDIINLRDDLTSVDNAVTYSMLTLEKLDIQHLNALGSRAIELIRDNVVRFIFDYDGNRMYVLESPFDNDSSEIVYSFIDVNSDDTEIVKYLCTIVILEDEGGYFVDDEYVDDATIRIPTETGTKLYKHSMSQGGDVTVEFISTDNTPKSFTNIVQYISYSDSGSGFGRQTVDGTVYMLQVVTSLLKNVTDTTHIIVKGIFVNSTDGTNLYLTVNNTDTKNWYNNCTDTVTAL